MPVTLVMLPKPCNDALIDSESQCATPAAKAASDDLQNRDQYSQQRGMISTKADNLAICMFTDAEAACACALLLLMHTAH